MNVAVANGPAAWSARAAAASQLDAVGWTESGQRDRFDAVLAALDPQPAESLLDFGCGTGALADRVAAGVEYVGYDWAPAMIVRAAAEHAGPGRSFRHVLPDRDFDVVAAVGPFNLPDGWSKQQTWQTLRGLWDVTRRALAVCLYAGADESCLRYTEDECVAFAIREVHADGFSVTRHRYNDVLVVMRR